MSYLLNLWRRSRRLFLVLLKVMLPIMVLVQVGQWLGWVDVLGRAIAPAMGLLDLPPEAGIVWVAGMCVGVYGAIAALIGLAPVLDLNAAQLSVLCSMVLFAHGLPVEQAIVRRAGASFWATTGLRVGAAILYGAAVAWTCRWAGWLQEPVSLGWLQSSALASDTQAGGLLGWLSGTAVSLLLTYGVIVALLVLLDIFERTGVTRAITAVLMPLLRLSGLDARVAPVTTVGVLLGLSYGGALIIEEADKRQLPARTRFLALSWISLSHSLIEDTALLLTLGADIWIILVGRVLLTLAVVAALARIIRGGDPAGTRLSPAAG
ncbi:nucleoside recognition domain-containing protein [Bordetella petrii]|uniref:nucleoside recognition domain-containing protein n=1 Tax=Bordetella petrii TaxID=94624 RepID=UPI00372E7848